MAGPSLVPLDGERCEECFREATRIVIYEALAMDDHACAYLCPSQQCLVNHDAWLGELWVRVSETEHDTTDDDSTGAK